MRRGRRPSRSRPGRFGGARRHWPPLCPSPSSSRWGQCSLLGSAGHGYRSSEAGPSAPPSCPSSPVAGCWHSAVAASPARLTSRKPRARCVVAGRRCLPRASVGAHCSPPSQTAVLSQRTLEPVSLPPPMTLAALPRHERRLGSYPSGQPLCDDSSTFRLRLATVVRWLTYLPQGPRYRAGPRKPGKGNPSRPICCRDRADIPESQLGFGWGTWLGVSSQ